MAVTIGAWVILRAVLAANDARFGIEVGTEGQTPEDVAALIIDLVSDLHTNGFGGRADR
jgi:hypothetical protein